MKIWVYAESEGDKPTTATLELLTKARELGDVECVYVGGDAASVAPTLGEYGAAKVFVVDAGESLAGVIGAAAVAQLAGEHSPDLILFAQSYDGRDALARLSVKLDRTVLTNGMSLSADGDTVTVGTAIFGGNTLVDTAFEGPGPHLAAIRPKSFTAEPGGAGAGEIVEVGAVDAGRAAEAKILERHVEEREGPKLEEAAVVVSGGRGIGAAENYEPLVEELAKLLKGASGRVACDRRRRLGALLEAGRSDRQDREAEGVHRARHQRRDPAHGRHEGLGQHHRRQQGRRGADLLGGRPRHRR